MANSSAKDVIYGISFAFLLFLLAFSAIPYVAPIRADATTAPIFSITLVAPVSNPQRRAYASIITQSLQQEGIGASLAYVTFGSLVNRLFGVNTPNATSFAKGYAGGSYDLGFIGWSGFGIPPDPEFWFLGNVSANQGYNGGNDYYGYNSSVTNSLILQYLHTIDQATRTKLLQDVEYQLYKDSPQATLLYQNAITAVPSNMTWYGQPASKYDPVGGFVNDPEHYGGITTLNIEETGDLSSFDPLPIAASNSVYNANAYNNVFGYTEELDPRANPAGYYLDLATSITHSSDLLTWNITVRPSTFQDSVPVTADDYLYYYWATLNPLAASVNSGLFETDLGCIVDFTWLNGTTTEVNEGPSCGTTHGAVTALGVNEYQLKLPAVYSLTDPYLTLVEPLPMHYLSTIPVSNWASDVFSTGVSQKTFTWNPSTNIGTTSNPIMLGGNGSYIVRGPFGNGPYVFGGFNPATTSVTLYANLARAGTCPGGVACQPGYWNATGLTGIGEFSITTINIKTQVEKTAAESDYKSGIANYLDQNYFSAFDLPTLQSIGATISQAPSPGYQEMGFNLLTPIVGTGTATPDGKAHPANAATDAMYVRQAIEHLIPRQLIIQSLYAGGATAGVTPIGTFYGAYQNSSLTAYTYDPSAAATLLTKAGYIVPSFTPNTLTTGSGTLLLGSSVSLSVKFVSPTNSSQTYDNALVIIQSSTDQSTWTTVGNTLSDSSGSVTYYVTPSSTGTIYYRANMTGYFTSTSSLYTAALSAGASKIPPGVSYNYGYSAGQNSLNNTFYLLGKSVLSSVTSVSVQPANALSTITDYAYAGAAAAVIIAVVLGALLFLRRKRP